MAFTLQARQGDTFTVTITLREDDNTTPVNLTGCSAEFSLAPVALGAPAYQFTTSPEVVITTPASGVIDLLLTPTQTRALVGGAWFYEVTVTFVNTRRLTVLDGFLVVAQEVKA